MPRKFRKDRLLELAAIMDGVPDKNYDQNVWTRLPDGAKTDGRRYDKGNPQVQRVCVPEGFCNTTACVLGHAALSGKFGLEVVAAEGDRLLSVAYRGNKKAPKYHQVAGAAAFGIPYEHAAVLFSGGASAYPFYNGGRGNYDRPSPQQVAKRLREYAENPAIIEEFI